MNKIKFLIVFVIITLFSACSAKNKTVEPVSPALKIQATELNQKATKAYKQRDYALALDFYTESLRLSRATEDFNGIASNTVNIAATLRMLGHTAQANTQLEELLETSFIEIPDETKVEILYLKALITLEIDKSDALKYAQSAINYCDIETCMARGRIHNLIARILLAQGNTTQSFESANEGLTFSQKFGDQREEANAFRIQADAKMQAQNYVLAENLYTQALEIDKALALGRKVFFDLMGLGNLYLKIDKIQDAEEYFQRALSVAENLDYKEGIDKAQRKMCSFSNSCDDTLSEKNSPAHSE